MVQSSRKKLLLMGRSGSGKSSMRSIIFSNYSAYDTRRLGATIDVEHSHLRFLGHMTLNLWDCGGQDIFIENYFGNQRDHIFRMVEVLIHVFDVETKEVMKDIETFLQCLKYLKEFSPDAKVFVLLHKMDLVQKSNREEVYNVTMRALSDQSREYGFDLMGFATSIWDESLYKAWSSIVCSLIPNMLMFNKHLEKFTQISEAREVMLFEKTTFLVISHFTKSDGVNGTVARTMNDTHLDPQRFEKISNIIKTFKQSCSKMRSQFQSITIHAQNSSAYIESLTPNTIIMVIMPSGTDIDSDGNAILANVQASRVYFEKAELES